MKTKSAFLILLTICITASIAHAGAGPNLSKGQTVYVPAYSHIYIGTKGNRYPLTITLSIRNIDPAVSIRITHVEFYETQGKFLKAFVSSPVSLPGFASTRYLITQKENEGGSGANFIVEWESDTLCNPPIIEAIMIGTQSQQGISFTSRGVPIVKPKK